MSLAGIIGLIGGHFLPNAISITSKQHSGKQHAANFSMTSMPGESTVLRKDLVERCPLVKMCGITSPRDAAMAVESGASLIGMILSPGSKRSISSAMAKEVSKISRDHGAEPVGVFVDDDVNTILRAADASGVELLQLHGDVSRAGFSVLRQWNRIIYVLHTDDNGNLLNYISSDDSSLADWILVDGRFGGSGQRFNWEKFQLPAIRSKRGWLLAGGISCENVCEAIAVLKPNGIDVSSGICGPDGVRKDPVKIDSFMARLKPGLLEH